MKIKPREVSTSCGLDSKRLLIAIAVLSLITIVGVHALSNSDESDAAGAEFTLGDYRYVTTGSNTVQLLGPISSTIVNVDIPGTVNYVGSNYSVTSIAEKAFYELSSVKTIRIPETITAIGENAFANCKNVTSLFYDAPSLSGSANFRFAEIGMSATAMSVTFGPHVTTVPEKMFNYAQQQYVTKNSKINSITFQGNVTTIGNNAFYYCDGITSISLPNSITTIGEYAFTHCIKLSSITLPSELTTIGTHAFDYCTGLTSITIPEKVKTIGNAAFYDARNLSSITVNATLNNYTASPALFGLSMYTSGELITLTFGDNVSAIPNYFGYGSSRIHSVTIPASVKSIGNYAFTGCLSISDVTMYGAPTLGTSCFNIGEMYNSRTVAVKSICESGFLKNYGGSYTTFNYTQFPHVSIDLDGHTLTSTPSGWFLRDGALLKYYAKGDSITIPTISATGYEFKGLTTTPATTMPDYTLIYHANWEILKVKISFLPNGGSGSQAPMQVDYNQNASLPSTTTFTRDGYTFSGWATSSNGYRVYNLNNVKTDTNVYALWTSTAKVTISFNANGGSGSQTSTSVTYGTTYNVPTSTTFTAPTGKVFSGWSKTPGGSIVFSFTANQNTTLYATWINAPIKNYTITLETQNVLWNGNSTYLTGGTVTGGGYYASGSTITLKATPADGWKFEKWSDGNTSATRSYTVNGDKTLVATFSMKDPQQAAEEKGEEIGKGILGMATIGVIAVVIFGALLLYAISHRK